MRHGENSTSTPSHDIITVISTPDNTIRLSPILEENDLSAEDDNKLSTPPQQVLDTGTQSQEREQALVIPSSSAAQATTPYAETEHHENVGQTRSGAEPVLDTIQNEQSDDAEFESSADENEFETALQHVNQAFEQPRIEEERHVPEPEVYTLAILCKQFLTMFSSVELH